MVRSEGRLLSQPCPVYFAGFTTNTYALQQAGWKLSVEQDIRYMRIRLAMHFEPAQLYLMADGPSDFNPHRYGGDFGNRPPEFHVKYASSRMVVTLMESSFDFRPIDATPQFTTQERKSIEDFNIFATPLARTEELIVEPATVAGLLEEIRKLQDPELAAIRKRNMRSHGEAGVIPMPMQRTQFHAQIVSLAA